MLLKTDKPFYHGTGLSAPKLYVNFISKMKAVEFLWRNSDLGLKESVETISQFIYDNGIVMGMYVEDIENAEQSSPTTDTSDTQ